MGVPHRETLPHHFATPGERAAYARGVNSRDRWPAHKPPMPPEGVLRDLLKAAQELRDAADTLCATFDPQDEVVQRLSPGIDAVDWAMNVLTDWLRDKDAP